MLLMLRYRAQIKDFIGDVGFAEKYLGVGGTHTFLIIVALFAFILPLMYAMGTLQTIVGSTIGRFF